MTSISDILQKQKCLVGSLDGSGLFKSQLFLGHAHAAGGCFFSSDDRCRWGACSLAVRRRNVIEACASAADACG